MIIILKRDREFYIIIAKNDDDYYFIYKQFNFAFCY